MAEEYKPPTNVTVIVRPYGRGVPKNSEHPIRADVADPIIADAKAKKKEKWDRQWHDFSRLGANGNPEGARRFFLVGRVPWHEPENEDAG